MKDNRFFLNRTPIIIACSMLLFSCSFDTNDQTNDEQVEVNPDSALNAALLSITKENIEASLAYLASDEREGRMTGSQGYLEAAAYVANKFNAMGLEPGGTDGWYQDIPFITRLTDGENSGAILHKKSGDVDLKWKDDVIIYADRVLDETSIKAEVVFVGFGVHSPENNYSDYDGIDVTGKIVTYFDDAPAHFPSTELAYHASGATKAAELVRRGAVGAIRLTIDDDWENYIENLEEMLEMSWIGPSGEIADYLPELQGYARISNTLSEQLFEGAPLTFEEAMKMAEDAKQASVALGTEVTLYSKSVHERISSPNVIGILRGSDTKLSNEYVVYSTHLDHLGVGGDDENDRIYNGYYDNAIGVSMVLEMARILASLPVAPKRSIIFAAVTGEEHGLLGSDYFARFPTVSQSALVANVNIDMPLVLFPLNSFTGYGAEHSSLEELAIREARKEGFEYMEDPFPEEVYFIRSDQYSFVKQGIPAVYFAEGIGSSDPNIDGRAVLDAFYSDQYHTVSDDSTQGVHWETALRFTRSGTRIGFGIAMDLKRPTWKENNFFGTKFNK